MITSQKTVRDEFWRQHPEFKNERRSRKRQNDYNATIRSHFCVFVDYLQKSGMIGEVLAGKVSL